MPSSALGFVKPPIIKPFTLPDRTRRGIAAALGLPALPNIVAYYIEGEIEVLKATSASVQPTIGDVQATIDDATKILSRANRAWRRSPTRGAESITRASMSLLPLPSKSRRLLRHSSMPPLPGPVLSARCGAWGRPTGRLDTFASYFA
jgi:hypothetical protein